MDLRLEDRIAAAHSLLKNNVNRPERFSPKHRNVPPDDGQELNYGDSPDILIEEPRSISAVMASEGSSRSRKGSQLLGLFKENDKAIEERGRERQRREEREREKEKERKEKLRAKDKERDESARGTAAKGNESVTVSPLQSTFAKKNKENNLFSDSISVSRTKDDKTTPSSRDISSNEAVPGDASSAGYVAPPVSGTSLIPLSPSVESPNPLDKRINALVRAPSGDSGYHEDAGSPASSYSSTVVDRRIQETIGNGSESSDHTASEHNEEDEEDAEDEISSAVYFPHTTPSITRTTSTATIHSRQQPETTDQLRRQDVSDRPRVYPSHSPATEFDLSIKKDDDTEYHYHGERRRASFSEDHRLTYPSAPSSVVSMYSDQSDYEESSTDDIERSVVEEPDVDITPRPGHKLWSDEVEKDKYPRHRYNHRKTADAPLGAVELKPYKHQVGGHTALFRFSKKAVCKSLSNRENEFYEAIETRHPELLRFLPR
jgi:inositol-hexakisphosphate kinase